MLSRTVFAAVLTLIGSIGPTRAPHANLTEATQLRQACSAELTRYCPVTPVMVQPQAVCLHQYYLDLSLTCRNALKRVGATGSGPT